VHPSGLESCTCHGGRACGAWTKDKGVSSGEPLVLASALTSATLPAQLGARKLPRGPRTRPTRPRSSHRRRSSPRPSSSPRAGGGPRPRSHILSRIGPVQRDAVLKDCSALRKKGGAPDALLSEPARSRGGATTCAASLVLCLSPATLSAPTSSPASTDSRRAHRGRLRPLLSLHRARAHALPCLAPRSVALAAMLDDLKTRSPTPSDPLLDGGEGGSDHDALELEELGELPRWASSSVSPPSSRRALSK